MRRLEGQRIRRLVKKYFFLFSCLLIFFLLCGCKDNKTVVPNVVVHEVTQPEIQSMAEAAFGHKFSYVVRGFTMAWDDGSCDVYMMAMADYQNELVYEQVLGHEMRHCLEGDFHETENVE